MIWAGTRENPVSPRDIAERLDLRSVRKNRGLPHTVFFVEVHAWHTEWSEDRRESSSDWLGELSVLASTDHGEMVRYPVITCMRIGRVTRLATKLADFFGVERRILSQTPFSGN